MARARTAQSWLLNHAHCWPLDNTRGKPFIWGVSLSRPDGRPLPRVRPRRKVLNPPPGLVHPVCAARLCAADPAPRACG